MILTLDFHLLQIVFIFINPVIIVFQRKFNILKLILVGKSIFQKTKEWLLSVLEFRQLVHVLLWPQQHDLRQIA